MINGSLDKKIRGEGFSGDIRQQVPMHEATSFKIGGAADHMFFPEDQVDLQVLLGLLLREGVGYLLIGKGTNLLVSDKGVREPLINLSRGFREIQKKGTTVMAGGGIGLPQLLHFCADNALTGLESLTGIPGTVGGGIRMNAGSWGVEISDLISSLMVMDRLGGVRRLKRDEVGFEYRTIDLPADVIILQGEFSLQLGNSEEIKGRMEDCLRRRKETQPLSLPSAGSIFKNPLGISAGELIEGAGLKGLRLGDAMVSPLHANFILNLGSARSGDVLKLIELIQERVYEMKGMRLEPEVQIIGEPDTAR